MGTHLLGEADFEGPDGVVELPGLVAGAPVDVLELGRPLGRRQDEDGRAPDEHDTQQDRQQDAHAYAGSTGALSVRLADRDWA